MARGDGAISPEAQRHVSSRLALHADVNPRHRPLACLIRNRESFVSFLSFCRLCHHPFWMDTVTQVLEQLCSLAGLCLWSPVPEQEGGFYVDIDE